MRGLVAVLGLALMVPASAHAWEHNGLQWPAERFPLPIVLNPTAPRGLTLEVLEPIVVASLEAWNDVPCSFAVLDYVGQQELPIAIDDDQVFAWQADADAWIYGTATAGATIIDMVTGTPRVDIEFNDISFSWVVDANTLVLPDHVWSAENPIEVDPGSVITHEVGHLLGMAHPRPTDPLSQPDPLATMVFALLPNAQQSTLAFDDKVGLCARYPVDGASECGVDADCDEGEFCRPAEPEGSTPLDLCDEARAQIGDFCSATDYNCQGTCLFQAADLSSGFCTELCVQDTDCPDGWECDGLPTTGGQEVFACLPEGTLPEEDTGVGLNDGGFTVVEDDEDAGDDAPGDTASTPDAPDTAPDVGLDAGADTAVNSDSPSGCGAAHPTGGPLGSVALAALVVSVRRRRR